MLVGRGSEQRQFDALLSAAREGTSGTLVLVGDPGIGKTALLEYAAGRAAGLGFNVLRARGVQSEAELAFGALLELCRPILDRLERIEPRQKETLRAAIGMSVEHRATPFAIGAATLALIAAAAEDRALLLAVDDAQWLDRESSDALAFAVRRLRADAVASLFATRPGEGRPFSGRELPELELTGLDTTASADLVRLARVDLDAAARARIIELAGGNPLALLELPRHLDVLQIDAEPVRVGKQLEHAFRARALALPDATRRALVVAAATTSAELGVVAAALMRLGLSVDALDAAEAAGLVSLDRAQLAFRHPLVRSALYHAADASERRAAHAALGATLADDDRGVWHLAAAAAGPDARVADGLERSAETASRRAGYAAAAAAYERAARLSEERHDRLRRLRAAADAAWLAGRPKRALALIEEALAHARGAVDRGELLYLRGTIEHFTGDPDRAHVTLEEAAGLLAESNRRLACLSLTQANGSLLVRGEVKRAVVLSERLVEVGDPDRPDEWLLVCLSRGASLLMDGRPDDGVPFLRRAADAIAEDELLATDPRNLPWAALTAFWLGDIASMSTYATTAVQWAREHAAVATLAFSARLLGRTQLITGNWRAARASLTESLDSSRISGQVHSEVETLGTLAWLDAAQGREDDCRRNIEEARKLAEHSNRRWRNDLLRALVLLELAGGAVEPSPVERIRHSAGDVPLLRDTPANATVPDFVEALVRAGDHEAAADLLAPFAQEAEVIGQEFARATAARCRGLLASEAEYADHFDRALELHARDPNVFATARTQLAYGIRLRRSGRRIDAREQLSQALGVFDRLEARPWADRARSELRSTGQRVRSRERATSDELTPQELQVAMLVAEGKTNREVGAQLFLSPKTIEWHLGHVYQKLGIHSRVGLARALGFTADTRIEASAVGARGPAVRPPTL